MPHPEPTAATPPKVSLHLPVSNAPPEMVCRTLDALALLDHPDFEVLVVDNNTSDPALWEPIAEHCARLGPRFRFFHLGRWPGFKAGALNFALQETAPEAEIIGVLDSDELVSPHWLRRMVPAFADPKVGFAQSVRDFRDNGRSLFKRLILDEYSWPYGPSTMTLVRVAALRGSGNWAAWSMTEDVELELRLMRQGWRSVHAPESFGKALVPGDFAAASNQRFRRAYGAMGILRAHWRALLFPFGRELSFSQRRHFLAFWLPWLGDAIGVPLLLAALVCSVGLILEPVRTTFPILPVMLSALGIFAVRLAPPLLQRPRVPGLLPGRIGAAIASLTLSHTTGKAVLCGLATRRMPFLRPPRRGEAPALVQGIEAAREEFCLLVLTWSAMVGVAAVHGIASWDVKLWCLTLLALSLPYLAAVAVAIVAALPARHSPAATLPELLPTHGPSLAPGE